MKYPGAHIPRPGKTPAKVLAKLSHKMRNQVTYIILSTFALRVGLENTLPPQYLEEFLKMEHTAEELQRTLKALFELIDSNASNREPVRRAKSAWLQLGVDDQAKD